MDPARKPVPKPSQDPPTDRSLAVVTPLFRDRKAEAWTPVTLELPVRSTRRHWIAASLLGGVVLCVALFRAHVSTDRVADRVQAGCLDVDDCRSLVYVAETSSESCWIACDARSELVAQARVRFRQALELQAHRERQRQDDAYEHTLDARRRDAAAKLDHEHAQRLEELDRQHRHELAVLDAETERLRDEKSRLQQQRVSYLRQLSREQRSARLGACHDRGVACDDLVVSLSEAAANDAERSELIDAHERHVTKQPSHAPRRADSQAVRSSTPVATVNSPLGEPALL